jgi:putative ABC transport system permease protein
MFKNYLSIALRNLKKQKGYSFINIVGLSVGIACFILIMLYIQYEFKFEMFHDNIHEIYQITEEQQYTGRMFRVTATPAPLAEVLPQEFPEILHAVRLCQVPKLLIKYENDHFYESKVVFTDPSLFQVFSFPLLYGEKDTALNKPYTVVFSEESAKKYFGDANGPFWSTTVFWRR